MSFEPQPPLDPCPSVGGGPSGAASTKPDVEPNASGYPSPDDVQVQAVVLAPHRLRSSRWVLPTVTGLVGLLVGAGGMAALSSARAAADSKAEQKAAAATASAQASASASAEAARAALLPGAIGACGLTNTSGLTLADGATTLTFDMKGKEDLSGAAIHDISCVFTRLDMPTNISSHINQTTALDGRQTESWNGLTISWSYHPDRGLDGVISVGATS